MEFRNLKQQYQVLQEKIDKAVLEVMTDCNFISGRQVKDLEIQLAEYVGTKHCITCGNGTDALTMMLMAWGIGPGDAVFVPDFTFFATGEVVSFEGATPVFVDVDSDTFNMDPVSLEKAILAVKTEGKLNLRVVIPVDLFGLPADYDHINDDHEAEYLRSIAVHGKGSFKYDNVRIGWNSRLDTIQAAVLLVKFEVMKEYELEAINKVASWYTEALKDVCKTPVVPEGYYSSWAQYTIQLESEEQRDKVQASLKEKGIPSMIYYPKPMREQTAFKGLHRYADCPVTERLCKTVLALPLDPYKTREDIETVYRMIHMAIGY